MFCSMIWVTESLDGLAPSAGVGGGHAIDGGAMVGYCEIGRRVIASDAGKHDDDRDHPGEDRPIDEEA